VRVNKVCDKLAVALLRRGARPILAAECDKYRATRSATGDDVREVRLEVTASALLCEGRPKGRAEFVEHGGRA
jgi:hypothetical protein